MQLTTKQKTFDWYFRPESIVLQDRVFTLNSIKLLQIELFPVEQEQKYRSSNTITAAATQLLQQQHKYCSSNTITAAAIQLLQQQYNYCSSNTITVAATQLL